MNVFPINQKNKLVHVCSICKKNFFWNDQACWYGTWMNDEGNEEVLEKCCSNICFKKSKYKEKSGILNE